MGERKNKPKKMKKGVDKRGKACYYIQAARERAARLREVETKSFGKNKKGLDKGLRW